MDCVAEVCGGVSPSTAIDGHCSRTQSRRAVVNPDHIIRSQGSREGAGQDQRRVVSCTAARHITLHDPDVILGAGNGCRRGRRRRVTDHREVVGRRTGVTRHIGCLGVELIRRGIGHSRRIRPRRASHRGTPQQGRAVVDIDHSTRFIRATQHQRRVIRARTIHQCARNRTDVIGHRG